MVIKKKHPTPGMPHDGLKGAPDGVNTQGEEAYSGSDKTSAREAGGMKDKESGSWGGFSGHGGQSVMGYHGPQQLGEQVIKPGGNKNAGSTED